MGEKVYTGSFARIYDDIMGAVPYDLWYNYLHELLDYYCQKPIRVLDLACGTGNMSLRFAENGYQVSGLDRSREMLEVARAKADDAKKQIDFIQADLRDFRLAAEYDLAFSLFDSLNYILEEGDLKKVFKNVFRALKKEGLFIFDMNTLKRLMSIKPGTTMFSGENYTCFWEDIIDRGKKRWQVRLKIYLDGDENRYFEEFHEETGYATGQIVQFLNEAGFQYIDVYNAYTFDRGSDDDNRLYFVAFKDPARVKKKSDLKKFLKKIRWRVKGFF